MIGLLHGYLLDGSGSNLWTREVLRALARQGETVHVFCQEAHPEQYDFISKAFVYEEDGSVETLLQRESPYAGEVIMHKPRLGPLLPVYVRDRYEEFPDVVPMVELETARLEAYIERNLAIVRMVIEEHGLTVLHANHTVLMSVVAQRAHEALGIPYAIMPHGSAIEYAVKKDARLHAYAQAALAKAQHVFVIGQEIHDRVLDVFPRLTGLERKMTELHLGVDTSLFQPRRREARRESIDALAAVLEGETGGKRAEQTTRALRVLDDQPNEAALIETLGKATDYDGKRPDEDVAEKLRAVDWENDRILLFVGRLIASKGVHSVVAALPWILAHEPDTRLLVVGHGPFREVLEAMVVALERGDRAWFEALVRWGSVLEDPRPGELREVRGLRDHLDAEGRLDEYFRWAQSLLRRERVIFTGYLTHDQLRHVFPCCDAAVFPSVVAEAGPLVFLEALSSGVFPLGTDFAGMGASIERMRSHLDDEVVDVMRLAPVRERTAIDIAKHVPRAFARVDTVRSVLRTIAVERYDWRSVARILAASLGRDSVARS